MRNRMKLLAAVAAVALPAAMAGAQGTVHVPLGQPAPPPSRTTHPTPAPTANTATEDAQTTVPPANTPATVNQNAEPGTQADAAAQAATQAQTAPPAGQPAPAANAQAQAATTPATPPVRAATAADLRAGVQVRDQAGGVVGTVESADAAGAVVSTGTVRARLPVASFGTNGQNLVISMTKTELEAAAGHAAPQPSAG